jgi:hypothetical protein
MRRSITKKDKNERKNKNVHAQGGLLEQAPLGDNGDREAEAYRLARLLLKLILARRSGFKKPNLQAWTKDIDLMIRIDKRDPGEIERVIRWCQKDPFWQNNILSPRKLRKQFDQLAMKMSHGESKNQETDRPKIETLPN